VQIMSAGTGIQHSEFNPSPLEPVRLLQIWILPERRGLQPRYDQQVVPLERGVLRQIAAREPEPGAVRVFQDASVYVARLGAGQRVEHALEPGRTAWVQVARGAVHLDDVALREGDGAAVTGQDRVAIQGDGDAEVLVFDLSMRH
jgi:redox-sensitive bicupin YhaK (pirin superfamily)